MSWGVSSMRTWTVEEEEEAEEEAKGLLAGGRRAHGRSWAVAGRRRRSRQVRDALMMLCAAATASYRAPSHLLFAPLVCVRVPGAAWEQEAGRLGRRVVTAGGALPTGQDQRALALTPPQHHSEVRSASVQNQRWGHGMLCGRPLEAPAIVLLALPLRMGTSVQGLADLFRRMDQLQGHSQQHWQRTAALAAQVAALEASGRQQPQHQQEELQRRPSPQSPHRIHGAAGERCTSKTKRACRCTRAVHGLVRAVPHLTRWQGRARRRRGGRWQRRGRAAAGAHAAAGAATRRVRGRSGAG